MQKGGTQTIRPSDLISEGAHWIPWIKVGRDFAGRGKFGLGQILAENNGLINEGIKEFAGHDIVAFDATFIAPGIFYFPTHGSPVFDINAGDDHGVIHRGMAIIEHIFLAEFDIESKHRLIIEGFGIPCPRGTVAVEADIRAKPNWKAIAKLLDDQFFHAVHRKVEVVDGVAFDNVAKIIDGVVSVEWLVFGWRVDDGLIL